MQAILPQAMPLPIPRPSDLDLQPEVQAEVPIEIGDTRLLLLARADIQSSADLEGRRIAIRAGSQDLREAMTQFACRCEALDLEWPQALERLASGEVDAVAIALAPALSATQENEWGDHYRLVAMPLVPLKAD